MTNDQFNILVDCLETRTRNDGTEFICKKDNTPTELANIIDNVMYDNDQHDMDLNYLIMDKALTFLANVGFEEFTQDTFDPYDHNTEFASYYTGERLSYLNVWNQDEISQEFKDNGAEDIATACAMWFDDQVINIIHALRNEIINN